MTTRILLIAGIKKQKGSLIGIFLLMMASVIALTVAMTAFMNSRNHIREEMNRVGYGTFTAWISGIEDVDSLQNELIEQEVVSQTNLQELIFSGYSINEIHSDDEGELLAYQPEEYDYHFFSDELTSYAQNVEIGEGEIYLSPVMVSTFQVSVGDEIHFQLGRDRTEQIFTVAGFFEDPFMGSSMIDMKSFLISQTDYEKTLQLLGNVPEYDQIARRGAMLHIYADEDGEYSITEINQQLNSETSLSQYIEMMYSADTIFGFMILLQNIVTGFLFAFSILLILVILIVIANSIRNAIFQEWSDIGILKTIGSTGKMIWKVKVMEYFAPVFFGMISGVAISMVVIQLFSNQMVSVSGILMPQSMPIGFVMGVLLIIAVLILFFLSVITRKVLLIRPIQAILGQANEVPARLANHKIYGNMLEISLAVRQLISGWKRYVGVLIIMTLLTIFLSVVGRMSAWVGPNGEGLMNAFSVAEHDLGVQPMNSDLNMDDIRQIIKGYTDITDTYELAMEPGTVNGVDRTINVLDQPEWFHIINGNTVRSENEIVVTESVAGDLNVSVGDSITVSSGRGTADYTIVGIYECANEMGANVGMSREGYARIADVTANIWCTHYILADGSLRDTIMNDLLTKYRIDADIHTNSWSGLDGIVSALHILIILMYLIAAFIIGIVIALSGSKVLSFEQKNMAVYKSIGFTSRRLRVSFGLRYGLVAIVGAIIGIVISGVMADSAISVIFRSFGIGEFHSQITLLQTFGSTGLIILCVFLFAIVSSKKIQKVSVTTLLQEE